MMVFLHSGFAFLVFGEHHVSTLFFLLWKVLSIGKKMWMVMKVMVMKVMVMKKAKRILQQALLPVDTQHFGLKQHAKVFVEEMMGMEMMEMMEMIEIMETAIPIGGQFLDILEHEKS